MNQPIFTIAALYAAALAGIRAQNYERSTQGGSCTYRGANNTKCALGHGVSDELMQEAARQVEDVNGSGAYGLFKALRQKYTEDALFGATGIFEMDRFASQLQSLHDSTLDPARGDYLNVVDNELDFDTAYAIRRDRAVKAWEDGMRELAEKYAGDGCVYTEPTPAEATA